MISPLAERLAALCQELAESTDHEVAGLGRELGTRLNGPLRLALVGRSKAGKSTLLNALVGDRVAPTDFSECTRFVTWYEDGPDYGAGLRGDDGVIRPVQFNRINGKAQFALSDPPPADLSELRVTLPSRRLRRLTLADSPGFDSRDELLGMRTRHLVVPSGDGVPARVDVVVYLLRYGHRADSHFLDALGELSDTGSAANTLGVLSRADELMDAGVGAMAHAQSVAATYGRDPRLQPLLGKILPVSGLLAETAATLQEQEFVWLRQVMSQDDAVVASVLLSVDRFCDQQHPGIPGTVLENLSQRFGLFGLRWCAMQFSRRRMPDSQALVDGLLEVSGMNALHAMIEDRFELRARRLICRSVLLSARAAARQMQKRLPLVADRIGFELDRIEASAHELAELELLEALAARPAVFSTEERDDLANLIRDEPPRGRLGLPESTSLELAQLAASRGASYWRARSDHPLVAPQHRRLFDIAARSYEGAYAELA